MTTLLKQLQAIQATVLDGSPSDAVTQLDELMAETDAQALVMTDLLANLQAENERLRADAARYRWLVNQNHPSISLKWSGTEYGQSYTLTQVIDAAMKGAQDA